MPARIVSVRPLSAIEGARITIDGNDFPVDGPQLPDVRIGDTAARVVFASPERLIVVVPSGVDAGLAPIRVGGTSGVTAYVNIAAPFATGLHQVDNPVFDRDGSLYVTFSGTRGQQVPVSIFRVRPNGTRETFSSGISRRASSTPRRWPSMPTAACMCRAASRAWCTESRRTGPSRRFPPSWASRAA